jgi:hypothetical protein
MGVAMINKLHKARGLEGAYLAFFQLWPKFFISIICYETFPMGIAYKY